MATAQDLGSCRVPLALCQHRAGLHICISSPQCTSMYGVARSLLCSWNNREFSCFTDISVSNLGLFSPSSNSFTPDITFHTFIPALGHLDAIAWLDAKSDAETSGCCCLHLFGSKSGSKIGICTEIRKCGLEHCVLSDLKQRHDETNCNSTQSSPVTSKTLREVFPVDRWLKTFQLMS